MSVVATAIALVGVVGLVVILEALAPAIIVEIDGEDIFWPVDVVAQELRLVVGDKIGPHRGIVLVEVGDEIVVFVQAWKHRVIGQPLFIATLI